MAYVTPQTVAREVGQSERTIRRYFAEKAPRRSGYESAWWRFDEAQLEGILADLKNPSPTRRFGLKRGRMTPDKAREAKARLALGEAPKSVAAAIGVMPETLGYWRKRDFQIEGRREGANQ